MDIARLRRKRADLERFLELRIHDVVLGVRSFAFTRLGSRRGGRGRGLAIELAVLLLFGLAGLLAVLAAAAVFFIVVWRVAELDTHQLEDLPRRGLELKSLAQRSRRQQAELLADFDRWA